jgi:CheY-like chemotaxis protein
MSVQFPHERLARASEDARQLVERTVEHGHLIEALVEQLSQLGNHPEQSIDAARRLRVSAQLQRVAADKLLADLERGGPSLVAAPKTVLVVDDYASIREIVSHVLREAGFVVRTAADGLEALVTAHAMRPSVIVMDITMPVLNGIEATRLIKAAEATRHARVIAYTGEPSLHEGAFRQFDEVLLKPAPPHTVVATVQRAAGVW